MAKKILFVLLVCSSFLIVQAGTHKNAIELSSYLSENETPTFKSILISLKEINESKILLKTSEGAMTDESRKQLKDQKYERYREVAVLRKQVTEFPIDVFFRLLEEYNEKKQIRFIDAFLQELERKQ